ncbi:MAG: electron transfer flavoprotein subunit beta [Alphaproteobacteria bacterium]
MAEVCVLVSVGRHPASGRSRRANRDARAVELGLRLAGPALRVVHAGDPAAPGLRDYLGMGVARLGVLTIGAGDDPVPALIAHLRARPADLILTGTRAEAGEDSGLVPYLVAEALGVPLIAAAADVALVDGRARVAQVWPRGRRRGQSAALSCLVTVETKAPEARAVAFALARRGVIDAMPGVRVADTAAWRPEPARARPRRLRGARGGTALQRLAAAMGAVTGASRILVDPEPHVAAQAIWDYLMAEGIVQAAELPGSAA